jgi:hypothetical protein
MRIVRIIFWKIEGILMKFNNKWEIDKTNKIILLRVKI